ncbi:hypothetical protein F5Y00DRAFT_264114 [Daldinia vernicosa]|uniref:uncharacterized protein n=1 Tax=Daldinia vernicosa TaxID=114800 RepID=UPI002007F570|nr:uncharacterized protein F5Y00DRAFT_264114 [Daldinia vernicosa]KAI0846901.1 hypothetical protein F5Y00DRAFT_264114 [Daldinia vernicosa]
MSTVPRTPSPQPKGSSDSPKIPKYRAFSLSTLKGRFNHGVSGPVSPTSRAIVSRYFEGIPTPTPNNQFREPSPFYLPSSVVGSNSTRHNRPKEQHNMKPTKLSEVVLPLPPSAPGSPCPRHSQEQQSRPDATSEYRTAKDVPKKASARELRVKKLDRSESRYHIPGIPHKHNHSRSARLLGKKPSSKRLTDNSTKKRRASEYESTENSHGNREDEGRPICSTGSAIDQEPPKKRTKRHASNPEAGSGTGHPVPSHGEIHTRHGAK